MEVPVFVDGELFPGWARGRGHDLGDAAADADLPVPYGPDDDERLWLLDFHWPRGLTPLGMTTFATTYTQMTHQAATTLEIPTTDGIAVRFVGPFLYITPRMPPPEKVAARRQVAPASMAAWLQAFPERWERRARALDREFARLMAVESRCPAGIAAHLSAAVLYERWAWRVHFEEMYVLLAGHLRYREAMGELGVGPALADACLAGRPTAMSAGDAAVFRLARALGDPALVDTLLADVLAPHGDRAEGIADVGLASWRERPDIVLDRARLVAGGAPPPTEQALAADRERARAEARSLAVDGAAVDALLAGADRTNWIWWNEHHNALIDLRATLPLRRHALAAGRQLFDDPEGALLCSYEELMEGLRDDGTQTRPSPELLAERRAWLDTWRARREDLPTTRGEGVLDAADPILAEIFGMPGGSGGAGGGDALAGVPASPGVVEGTARVVLVADDLHSLDQGDVLVCPGTSPNWASAFAVVAAVVCDGGGMTTHAAICAREYGIPCVVAALDATRLLRSGDRVRVDGTRGTVTRLP
ncbi:MAG TPA: PEP-utilizing enzyme [Acidimicrobiales bacterium]|nr:PEP-utilizing enzyme [Acidimicrobiales bacterium]